jgi:hypothetical protein
MIPEEGEAAGVASVTCILGGRQGRMGGHPVSQGLAGREMTLTVRETMLPLDPRP